MGGREAFSFPISAAGELAKGGCQSLSVLEMTHGKNPNAVKHFQENPVGTWTYFCPLSLTPSIKTLAPKGTNAQQPERQEPDRREPVTALSAPWLVL